MWWNEQVWHECNHLKIYLKWWHSTWWVEQCKDTDGTQYEVTQITYSQALDMVSSYCTSSEPPDTSVEQVASPDVSNFPLN